MAHLPTKRLAVYIFAGLVVFVVGGLGVASLRGGGSEAEVVTVDGAGSAASGAGQAGQSASEVAMSGGGASGTTTTFPASTSSTSTTAAFVFVQVAGAVRHPGVYQVPADSRVFQVLETAGGLASDADQEALPLAAHVSDGCKIEVPRKGQPHGDILVTSGDSAAGGGAGSTSSDGVTPGGSKSVALVSLNNATVEQLETLPGIGLKIAQAIVDYREQHGPFTSIDELTDVKGIGPAKLEQLRPLVTL
jgi:competence protein ComEA